MAKATIFVADNNRAFLVQLRDFLKREGYSVIIAESVDEAKKLLQKKQYDLAILDVRLTDDTNQNDNSGILLAKSVPADIPKIILTKRPSHNVVRAALGPGARGLPAAIDFVAKKEWRERLLPATEDAIFIKALQDGDDKAWERFWKTEAWSVIALCRRHGISAEEAVSISLDIFGEMAKLIKRPQRRSSLRAQLVSKALREINKRYAEGRESKSDAAPQASVTGVLLANEELLRDIAAASLSGKLPRDEVTKRLTEEIEKLPLRQRIVVTLRLFGSVPTLAIAKKLGVTEKTVLKDMDHGFRQVRSKLAQLGE